MKKDTKSWVFIKNNVYLCIIIIKYLLINKTLRTIMAYVISDDCIACGTCIGECPVEAISEGEKYVIDADACTECGTCASVCPSEAISLPA